MKNTTKTVGAGIRRVTIAALLALSMAAVMPQAWAIGTVPLPESPQSMGTPVMVGNLPFGASTVMIGTWPTPEHPFPTFYTLFFLGYSY